jgi:acetyl esterase
MTRDEMIEKAAIIRGRDQYGAMTQEELAALPGTEEEIFIQASDGHQIHVFAIRPSEPLAHGCGMILNFHGGGFIKGRSDRDHRYASWLAQQLRCLVWDVDYCLAPEAPYPAALNETCDIISYAFAHAEEMGIDPAKIALSGHSAGGNLVCAAMLQAQVYDYAPCCLLMEYFPSRQYMDPADKLTPAMREDAFWVRRAGVEKEYALYYAEEAQLKEPLCSPYLASPGSFSTFPPCLIISAGTDTLRVETEEMAARIASEGVPVTSVRVEEAIHGFTVNRTEGWEKALKLHLDFFRYFLK